MLRYSNGQTVNLGDIVDFDGKPAIVVEILANAAEYSGAGMSVPVVGFSTSRLGTICQAPSDLGWESVALIRR